MPTPPALLRRPWLLLSVLAVAVLVAGHVDYVVSDTRVPVNRGLYYEDVITAWTWLEEGGAPSDLRALLTRTTGWYNLLLAGWLQLAGRSPEAFQGPNVLWAVTAVSLLGWLGARLGGPRAGFVAIALAGATPAICTLSRIGSIHVPETVLVLAAVAAWIADPAFARAGTAAIVAGMGAAAITLRASALPWFALLAPFLAWTAWRGKAPGAVWRLAAVAGVWGLAAIVPGAQLETYLAAKTSARDRYEAFLPPLSAQVPMVFGVPAAVGLGAVTLVGAIGTVGRKLRGGPAEGDVALPLLVLAAAWLAAAVLMQQVYLAGLDNFPLVVPGAVLLAAALVGQAGRLAGTVAAALAAATFLTWQVPAWLPPPQGPSAFAELTRLPLIPGQLNHYRPYTGFGRHDIAALLDATCGPDAAPRSCVIAVDQGLFTPFAEDDGHFELFLLGEDRVRVLPLRYPPLPDVQVKALSAYACPQMDNGWRMRFPASAQLFQAVATHFRMIPAWSRALTPGCSFLWLAPRGQVGNPELLPATQ